MKLISHRGNIAGPTNEENHPDYIDHAIEQGYDVEVDIRIESWGVFFLGHDTPEYEVTLEWLQKRSNALWLHCKNIEALGWLNEHPNNLKYFWHQEDDYTITSNRFIWTYPNKLLYYNSICVLPELGYKGNINDCYAICSDYIERYKD
jgi:hypothetical protein